MTHRRLPLGDESGIALVSALLVLLLMSSLMVGFSAMATTDTRVRSISGSRTQAFYFAHAGLEKLTADLGDLFIVNSAPTGAQIDALVGDAPDLPGVTWVEGDGDSGYRIEFDRDADGNPQPSPNPINTGQFQGFEGQIVEFKLNVTAHLDDGSEANLEKTIQTVAIPLFQFGMFSELDLSFFPGPSFNFGGRVHTNGNLFLAADPGPVSFSDPVTAVLEVIRAELANGQSTSSSHSGNVRVRTTPNAYRMLDTDEGSLTGGLGTSENEPTWTNLSTGVYNYNIRNGRTGAKSLELPIVTAGASVIDLIRRPVPNEDNTAPDVLAQRYFSMASLRILLSDTAEDITDLPTVTADPPIELGAVPPVGYNILDPETPPFALSPGLTLNGARTPTGTPLLGGFLKVEMQRADGTWQDVTLQILNLGIAGAQWRNPAGSGSATCATPSPDAVLRLQRFRDNDVAGGNPICLNGSLLATDYWPNTLYDPREGIIRDGMGDSTPPNYGGIMHYIELDAGNLKRWLEGTLAGDGANALNVDGYVVYFSDRRGNRNAANDETGEYGFEDVVNTTTGGALNGLLEAGEDVNGNGVVDVYGGTPRLPSTVGSWGAFGMSAPYSNAITPNTRVDADGDNNNDTVDQQIARANPAVFFRRALKVSNGRAGNVPMPGLTLVSENPVYINGTWNADPSSGFVEPNSATAFIADAVTLLSDVFSDRASFLYAHNLNPRNGSLTYYRFAAMAGKGLSFNRPAGTANDFGTDGGTHNFLRYIEDWNGNTLRYKGSLASMFYSRQAVGTYKCCADVYGAPTRGYEFDLDFLEYGLLPPRTPMFRDVNSTGFTQIIRPR